ncbi:MAG: hypothetical protein HQM01_13065 [Magnetococcales bacterium]|nr:hypothetical protein [Magnetococcales bacterium]
MEDLDLEDFPRTLQEIAGLIGVSATRRLVTAWGGSFLPVMSGLPEYHPIVRAIGRPACAALGDHFGAERPYLPRATRGLLRLRNNRLRALYDQGGVTVDALARQEGLSCRMVTKILGQVDAPAYPTLDFGE